MDKTFMTLLRQAAGMASSAKYAIKLLHLRDCSLNKFNRFWMWITRRNFGSDMLTVDRFILGYNLDFGRTRTLFYFNFLVSTTKVSDSWQKLLTEPPISQYVIWTILCITFLVQPKLSLLDRFVQHLTSVFAVCSVAYGFHFKSEFFDE